MVYPLHEAESSYEKQRQLLTVTEFLPNMADPIATRPFDRVGCQISFDIMRILEVFNKRQVQSLHHAICV